MLLKCVMLDSFIKVDAGGLSCPLANKKGIRQIIKGSHTVKFNYGEWNKSRIEYELKFLLHTFSFDEAYKVALENTMHERNIHIIFTYQKKDAECVLIVRNCEEKSWSVWKQYEVIKPKRERWVNQYALLVNACCDSKCIVCGNDANKYEWEEYHHHIGKGAIVFELKDGTYRAEGVCNKCRDKYKIFENSYTDRTLINLVRAYNAENS